MPRSLTLAVLLLLSTSAAAQFDALSFSLGPIERIEESDIAHSFGTLRNSAGIDVRNVTVAVVLRAPRTAYIGGQSDAFWSCRNGDNPYVLYCTAPLIRAFESVQLQVYVAQTVRRACSSDRR